MRFHAAPALLTFQGNAPQRGNNVQIVWALRNAFRTVAEVVATLFAVFMLAGVAVSLSDDPISAALRPRAETAINDYLAAMQKRAAASKLTAYDRAMLHLGVWGGIALGPLISPEGAIILSHAVYGDGSELRLDPSHFKRSPYLTKQIGKLGPGEHGPLLFPLPEETRLALAFQPVFISVSGKRVRVGHPRIQFAAANAAPVVTIVPIGKLRIRMFDNLVGALQEKPFAAYAEWRMQ
jgi:hypothetical protein